ncbi:ATP-binding protein [Sneathiella marina]|uniref:histidine kinase n=1 Tax=Sneathiella marina TaxID=2950108 RepID=A0ABY4W685_9PROT|nr:ATP-binding protein [Sneathiella marina]USG62371.1 ATP-binding protein [Sneathiella marina]
MGGLGFLKNAFSHINFDFLKKLMPRTLFGRSILIVVLPIILLQVLVTYIFYERHWDNVARRLAQGVAGDVAAVISLMDRFPGETAETDILNSARNQMRLAVSIDPGATLPEGSEFVTKYGFLEGHLARALQESLPARPFSISTNKKLESVVLLVQLPDSVMQVIVRDKRLFSSTTYIFVMWMVGISLALLGIALVFLRNQMRPIRQLSDAAEKFGKGQYVEDFKPSGAQEIRLASRAFHVMKNRILRQITQRTEMLAGVSHDLRTPLTRMKLQLAMMPEQDDKQSLEGDVADMEKMVEGYLAFARGQEAEAVENTDIPDLFQDIVVNARRQGTVVSLDTPQELWASVRPNSLKRCITNLINNAARYASEVWITVHAVDLEVTVTIDDDGPGIPEASRADVFKPFHRLDPSRNTETGGSGLGMTIARDVIHGHGGQITLGEAPAGGLRIEIRFPR